MKCPHCEHDVTVTSSLYSSATHLLEVRNQTGVHALRSKFIVCPNPECGKYILDVFLTTQKQSRDYGPVAGDTIKSWRLVPWGKSRAFPDYVPLSIRNDYEEACSIVDLSPKAAATLARRAVQGIIRGYWKISKATLNQELLELANHIGTTITQETWDSVDAIRKVGNIGAHMEKDIDIIVNVDPGEADLLIELVETLIEDTYIASHERRQRHERLMALKAKKEAEKTGAGSDSA